MATAAGTSEKAVNNFAGIKLKTHSPRVLKCVKCCAEYPCAVIPSIFVLGLLLLGALVGSDQLALSENSDADVLIKSDLRVEEFDAMDEARDLVISQQANSVPESEFDVFLLYRSRNGDNILTPSMLRRIQAVEAQFLNDKSYTDICLRVPNPAGGDAVCAQFASFVAPAPSVGLTFASSNEVALSVPFTVDPSAASTTQATIDALLREYALNATQGLEVQRTKLDPGTWTTQERLQVESLAAVSAAFGADFGLCDAALTTCDITTEYARSFFPMGVPLKGYVDAGDDFDGQKLDFNDAIVDFADFVVKELAPEDGVGDVQVLIFGQQVSQQQLQAIIATDILWAGASIAFVLLYLCIHTTSPFLGLTGMFQILISLPIAIFIYRIVFAIDFFQTLHALAIFVILGIGADNIFVFIDAFEQAPTDAPDVYLEEAGIPGGVQAALASDDEATRTKARGAEYAHLTDRLGFAFQRAVHATAVTSGTTVAAFLATAISPILPIGTFGIFAAVLIFVAWLLNMTLLPALVGFWYMNLRTCEKAVWRSTCGLACPAQETAASSTPSTAAKMKVVPGPSSTDSAGSTEIELTHPSTDAASTETPVEQVEPNPMFGHAKAASGPSSNAGHSAPTKHGESASAHLATRPMERFFHDTWTPLIDRFKYPILVAFVILLGVGIGFAIQLRGLSEAESFIPDDHPLGVAGTWMTEEFRQTAADDTVVVTFTWGVFGINRDGINRYKPQEKGTPIFDAAFDPSSPQAQQDVLDTCDAARTVNEYKSEQSCWMRGFMDWRVDQSMAFPAVAPTGQDQSGFFVSEAQRYCREPIAARSCSNGEMGIVQGQGVRIMQVKFVLSLVPNEPYSTTNPVYESWQEFVESRNAASTPGVNNAIQTAGRAWQGMITERELLSSAITGMAISISVAFLVLVFSTQNIITGSFATLSILGIVITVMLTVAALGWEMGIAVSVSFVILVGFSVDYVVHFASAYMESEHGRPAGSAPLSRFSRMQSSLTVMGVSVLAGAMTTFGASVFLFPAVVLIFEVMGTILMSTIAYSLLWSTVFFPAVMMAFGPVGDYGDLRVIYRALCSKCGGKEGGEAAAPAPAAKSPTSSGGWKASGDSSAAAPAAGDAKAAARGNNA